MVRKMVKKEQGQDDYFSQQSIYFSQLPAYISPPIMKDSILHYVSEEHACS